MISLQSGIVREVIFSDELERAPIDRIQDLLRLLVGYEDISFWLYTPIAEFGTDVQFWTRKTAARAKRTTKAPISRAWRIAVSRRSAVIVPAVLFEVRWRYEL